MTADSVSDGGDPFKDPSVAGTQTPQTVPDIPAGAILPVGRSASLTLGTDSLIVLGTSRIFS
jgi:sphingosine kinase